MDATENILYHFVPGDCEGEHRSLYSSVEGQKYGPRQQTNHSGKCPGRTPAIKEASSCSVRSEGAVRSSVPRVTTTATARTSTWSCNSMKSFARLSTRQRTSDHRIYGHFFRISWLTCEIGYRIFLHAVVSADMLCHNTGFHPMRSRTRSEPIIILLKDIYVRVNPPIHSNTRGAVVNLPDWYALVHWRSL